MVQKYHPDKTDDRNKHKQFAKISEAYKILSNKTTKNLYDSCSNLSQDFDDFNEEKVQEKTQKSQKNQQRQADYEFIFQEFDAFYKKKSKNSKIQKKQGEDIKYSINISFEESIYGSEKVIQYERHVTCKKCNGTRAHYSEVPIKCYSCGGLGSIILDKETFSEEEQICQNCQGFGQSVVLGCQTCEKKGEVLVTEEKMIKIPKGVVDQQVLRLQSEGNVGERNGPYGHLFIQLNVSQSDQFKRDGHNILSETFIEPYIFILGGFVKVNTLQGEQIIEIPKLTQINSEYRLQNFGVENSSKRYKGDQLIKLKIKIPSKLTQKQEQIYRQIQRFN